ncbi:MAG: 8-oxo-dGTP diphosphatase MutT [Gammaproteobacteria bacterium]
MNAPAQQEIAVAVGILTDADGRALLAQRPEGAHQAGAWEFPGGKLDDAETPLDGLRRELHEELGVAVRAAQPLMSYRHVYPDRTICLHVWRVSDFTGQPTGVEGQALRWVAVDGLMEAGLLPADRPIAEALLAETRPNRSSG